MVASRFLLATAVVLLAAGGDAVAGGCGESAARLAKEYDLQWPTPPVTKESRGMTATDKLAPSQGVVEPPPEGDTAMVVEPPEDTSNMPTAPDIAPEPNQEQLDDLTAEERTRMEALLLEAVKAEEEGDSKRCFERLNEAEAIP